MANNNRHSGTGATIALKPWQCPACTFENTSSSVVCDMCQSPRGLASAMLMTQLATEAAVSNAAATAVAHQMSAAAAADASRLESKLMENLRRIEETEARTKWENIIQYCKEVSDTLFTVKSSNQTTQIPMVCLRATGLLNLKL